MRPRISWLLVLLGALALVGVVILIVDDVSGDATTPDRPDAISDEPPNVEPNAAASRQGSGERAITPRRTAESEPARTVEIEVVRASGAPIADVPVVVFRDENVLLSAKTDRAGLVRLAASTGEAHAVAAVPGYRLIEERVSMEDERTRLVVPDGLEISGLVRVDGRAPKSAVTVALWRRDDPEPLELPGRVREIFEITYGAEEWRARTDEEGRFRFVGLPAGYEGEIHLGFPYEAIVKVGGMRLDHVRAPAHDVLVEARRYLEVSGRVVDGGTRAAIPRAPVVIEYLQTNGTPAVMRSGSGGLPSGTDGRFKIMLRASSVLSLTVKASASPGNEPTELKIEESLNDDRDVGDIAVGVGRLVTLLVKDEGGNPVANARAAPPETSRTECSEPTDADGKTSLRLSREGTYLKVGALGYEVTEVAVPADLTGMLEVTLPSGTMLTVRIVAAGAPVPGMIVRVRTSRNFLPVNQFASGGKDEPLMAAGMSAPLWCRPGSDSFYGFEGGAEGVVRLSGLPTKKTIGVQVTDPSGAPLFSEEVTLAKGERREVVATIAERARTLRGVVTDDAGKPIRGAVVMVAHDAANLADPEYRSGWTHAAKTDREGRFALTNLRVSKTHVGVAKSGYATLIQRDVPIPADGGEARFVLGTTPPVRVRITDSSGGPVNVREVTGSMSGASIARPGQEGSGVYVFKDCGNGSLDVRAKYANGSWSTTIDTSKTREGRITVPVLGGARLTWAKELDEGRQLIASLKPQDPALEYIGRRVNPGDEEFRFTDVAPGLYTASIEVAPPTLMDPRARKPLAEARVEIVEGQTAEVVFKRP